MDSGSTASYVYDGVGRRARKTVGSTTTDFIYDQAGHAVDEVNSAGNVSAVEVYAGGLHIVDSCCGTLYYTHQDWLGTERVMTLPNATVHASCSNLAFGDGQSCSGTWNSWLHYTGDYADTESNLDYTQFRQHSSTQGRWITPDPAGLAAVDVTNPQTWNRYAYVTNNPLSAIDPLGLDEDFCGAEYSNCSGGIGEVGGGIGGGGGGGGGFGGGGGPGVGFGGSGTSGLQNGLNQYLSYIPPFGDGWAPCTTPGSDCWYNTTTDANWYPGEYTSSSVFSDPTILTGTGGGIGGAGGGTGGHTCQAQILNATNNRFGTNYTNANVSSTFNYSTGAPPGQGTLNLNIFGSTAGVTPGYYPVNWWTYVIGYGPTLHAVSGPGGNGGLDSQLTLPFGPNQATFHIDSGFPYNPMGAFFHWLLNMTKAGGYPQC